MNGLLLGVVLCGGKSSRMGVDKGGLLHPNGETFLKHALQRSDAVCAASVISGTPPSNHGYQVLQDPVAHQGPVVGIATALTHAQENDFDACLITPVDVPFLSTIDLQALVNGWLSGNGLTVASSEQPQPLIGIYPVALRDELADLAASEDRSLLRWINRKQATLVSLSHDACRNINTPEDLTDA